MKTKIAIADDHPLIREALSQIIRDTGLYIITGTASNGNELLSIIEKEHPSLVILDIQMPQLDGYETAKILLRDFSEIKIILLTMFKEEEFIRKVFEMGIKGYVLKESALADILTCINDVLEDKYFLSPQISNILLKPKNKKEKLNEKLTLTENKILELIAEGKTSKEIAILLYISKKTVDNHRSNICKKLEIKGILNLVKFAVRNYS